VVVFADDGPVSADQELNAWYEIWLLLPFSRRPDPEAEAAEADPEGSGIRGEGFLVIWIM